MNQKENQWEPEDGTKEHLSTQVSQLLGKKAEMLEDYFSLQIDEKHHLVGVPLLLGKLLLISLYE